MLKTAFFSAIAFGGLYSFLYLNTIANPENANMLQIGEQQIIEKIDGMESKKGLPEAFLLEKLIEMGKKLIP